MDMLQTAHCVGFSHNFSTVCADGNKRQAEAVSLFSFLLLFSADGAINVGPAVVPNRHFTTHPLKVCKVEICEGQSFLVLAAAKQVTGEPESNVHNGRKKETVYLASTVPHGSTTCKY